ncbi:DinB family protein [Promicromonospora sp. NPDC023987]|uniref:DinB family protein n=1 Tax=Promicromonospora sp. NPDC023987 TaxID=3155360 RepID=UPI0033FD2480
MTRFTADDDLQHAEFVAADLTGARFHFADLEGAVFEQSYLPGAVLRGVDLTGADIDGVIGGLKVNGVEVLPLIEAELNRQYPGRALARSQVLAEQRESFEAAARTWSATFDRVAAMPAGTVDEQVDGEWSLAQTMRHLVFAVDGWVRHGVQGLDGAFSPIGLPFSEYDDEVGALGVDMAATPSFHEVQATYDDRVAQVRAQYDSLTQAEFEAPARRLPPWEAESRTLPVWRCLGVIVNEAWEHHRFAERDLDELERRRSAR